MSKITIEMFAPTANGPQRAIVKVTPSWLGRLFRQTTQSLIAQQHSRWNRDEIIVDRDVRFRWYYVNTGREVGADVYRALEHQDVTGIPHMRVIK